MLRTLHAIGVNTKLDSLAGSPASNISHCSSQHVPIVYWLNSPFSFKCCQPLLQNGEQMIYKAEKAPLEDMMT